MEAAMNEVQIEYCVPCGFLHRAEEVEHALLSALGQRIDALVMKPRRGGVFQVSVDGHLIFDKNRDDYDLAGIVQRTEGRIATAGERVGASQRED
jgi:selenoprotein W-related protein